MFKTLVATIAVFFAGQAMAADTISEIKADIRCEQAGGGFAFKKPRAGNPAKVWLVQKAGDTVGLELNVLNVEAQRRPNNFDITAQIDFLGQNATYLFKLRTDGSNIATPKLYLSVNGTQVPNVPACVEVANVAANPQKFSKAEYVELTKDGVLTFNLSNVARSEFRNLGLDQNNCDQAVLASIAWVANNQASSTGQDRPEIIDINRAKDQSPMPGINTVSIDSHDGKTYSVRYYPSNVPCLADKASVSGR